MAVGLAPAVANAELDAWVAAYPYVKLHVGDPGAAGTANAAAETTRKLAVFSAASGGATANTGALTWTGVAGNEDYTHISFWSAASGGTFGGSGLMTANAVLIGDTFTIPVGDLDITKPIAA